MTIRQLGDFAREHGISLAAAPTRQDMVDAIMAAYGNDYAKAQEILGRDK